MKLTFEIMIRFIKNFIKKAKEQEADLIEYGKKNQELYGDKVISVDGDIRIIRIQGKLHSQEKSFMGGWGWAREINQDEIKNITSSDIREHNTKKRNEVTKSMNKLMFKSLWYSITSLVLWTFIFVFMPENQVMITIGKVICIWSLISLAYPAFLSFVAIKNNRGDL